ncbi:MAG TPA: hypothetical protein VKR99_04165 [Candidatus Eremiobacteraceae bacterium]|nr:hypothetical protein [Candidatus Eremiobacteraceae bacterium]
METDRRGQDVAPQQERDQTVVEREEPHPGKAQQPKPRAPGSQHKSPGYEDSPGMGEDEGEEGRKRPAQEPGDSAAREGKDG